MGVCIDASDGARKSHSLGDIRLSQRAGSSLLLEFEM